MKQKQRWLVIVATAAIITGCHMPSSETDKYDPNLLELTESNNEDTYVTLILGLSLSADQEIVKALAERGLEVRSVIGDIVTGQCQIRHLSDIAGLEYVLKIEASREMDIDSLDNILE